MSLLRFLGIGGDDARQADPESITRLTRELESLPPEDARFVAAFAYLLARVAGADLDIDHVELGEITRRLEGFAEIDSERAALLAKSALRLADDHSATDDHLVARAFRARSDVIAALIKLLWSYRGLPCFSTFLLGCFSRYFCAF